MEVPHIVLERSMLTNAKRQTEKRLKEEAIRKKKNSQRFRQFSLEEMHKATRKFDKKLIIGEGGFGLVYKGSINDDAEFVAVKRSSTKSHQGNTEFLKEIETLSNLKHANIVQLRGYCNESPEMILVYEYMTKGTLGDQLYKIKGSTSGEHGLTWEQRLKICIGAASGLDFLHRECVPAIIHRDVKEANILLNHNFVAKIADFGVAKSETTFKRLASGVKGTMGYLDPDYFETRIATTKSDVYSFGVVLLVALAGRPQFDNKASRQSLYVWFRDCMIENTVDEIVDLRLAGKISHRSLNKVIKVIQKCLLQSPEDRPTMDEVIPKLRLALRYQREDQEQRPTMEEVVSVNFSLDNLNYDDAEYSGSVADPFMFKLVHLHQLNFSFFFFF